MATVAGSKRKTNTTGEVRVGGERVATEAFVNTRGFLTSETDSQTLSISGTTLSISNGNSVSVPTSIGPTGPQGPQGDRGPAGATGSTGPQGPQGEQGERGPQGTAGATGSRGPAGPTGPQGPQGEQGERGPQGATGAAGATGATGPQGPKGDTGDRGAVGPTGPAGARGATGATGPQGPQGERGPAGVGVAQTLSWNGSNGQIAISSGNTVDLDGRYLQSVPSTLNSNHTFNGTLTFNGVTNGLYHSVEEDHYYFDDYNGRRNINAFLKTQKSDIIKYRPIGSVEYWNGSTWVDATSTLRGSVQRLLDGRQDTSWSVPEQYYKFRFTVTASSSWPTMSLIGIQTSWSGSNYQGCSLSIEEKQTDNSWIEKVRCDFSSREGVGNWGTAVKADTALHTGRGGQEYGTRITVDFSNWSPSNPSYNTVPLQNIFIYSNFSGAENNDYQNLLDYERNISAPKSIYVANDIIGYQHQYLAGNLYHYGDTDTYLKFDNNRLRIYAGGTVKFDSNNTYLTSQTDSQTLSISGTTLSIANGNSVTLPTSIGPTGPQGPQGERGPAGSNGSTGPQGPQGEQGERGPQGATGATGARGPAGATGATGPQGPKGDTGDRGPTGSTGAVGPQGPQGERGLTGPAGSNGRDGAVGPQGPAGPQGDRGPAGATGATGSRGPAGATGPQGPAGRDGSDASISFTNQERGETTSVSSITFNRGEATFTMADGSSMVIGGAYMR